MPRISAPLTLEYVLLGLIEQNPVHGYDLYRQIKEMEGIPRIWNIKQSMLYALLDKLEENGLIACTIIPGETRPSRKQYHLTKNGKTALHTWMQSPVQHGRDMRQDFLARLYFSCQASDKKATQQLIGQQRQVCLGWLDEFIKQYNEMVEHANFDRFVVSFRIAQVKGMLEWLETCEQDLRE
jgi:PadR family transcriptional regulator, regulatory protein AphA